jgi:hypothetical protein
MKKINKIFGKIEKFDSLTSSGNFDQYDTKIVNRVQYLIDKSVFKQLNEWKIDSIKKDEFHNVLTAYRF